MQGKLSGIIPFYRRDFETYKHLKDQEKVLRWAVICNMGWNEVDHPNRFGVAEISNTELAQYIGWKSPASVTKWMPKLLAKNPGFFKDAEGRYVCYDFDAFIYREACSREKKITLEKLEYDRAQLAKRKVEFAENKNSISREKTTHTGEVVKPTIEITSSDSFKGNSLEKYKVTETYEEKKRRLLNSGMYEYTLDEPCFCGSGKAFIDCCAEIIAASLPFSDGVKEV